MADKEFDLAENISEASKIFKRLQSDLNKPASSGSIYDIIFHSSDYAKAMTGELMGNLIKQQSSLFEKLKQSEGSYKNQVSNTKEIEKRLSKLQTISKTLAVGSAERAKVERQILETQSDLEESVGKEKEYEQAIIQYKKSIINVNSKILEQENEISSASAAAAATASDNLINKIKTLPILQQEKQYQDLINSALNERENLEAKLATLGDVLDENGKVLVDRSQDRLEVETQIEQLNGKIAKVQEAEAKSSEVAAKLAARKLSTASEYAAKIAKNSEEQAAADREAAERHKIQTQQDIEDLKAKEKAAYKAQHGNLKGYKQSDALKEELKGIRNKAKEEQKILDKRAKASEAQARKDADEARKLARQHEDSDKAREKRLKNLSNIQKGPAKLGDKALAKQQDKIDDAEKRAKRSGEDIVRLEKELEDPNLSAEEKKKKEEELEAAKAENAQAKKDGMAADNMARAIEGLQNTMEQAFNELNSAMDDYNKYAAKIDARLQGSDSDYEDVVDLVKSNLALSPIVKTKEVMDKINEAIDYGLTYNLEQRAFLETISEKIADTFDAFDANLLRLIRLQQADSTAARLGMEATLTKLFNNMFEDTSYLTSGGAADSVAGAIIDAQSQMTRDQALEFEFTVQKWLGSLGSLGMGNETLSKIAEGLNYLGTGNVEALSGNESLQTLIAMSASKAGLSLADMLTGGITADTTNKLLESMVEYLKEIAEGDNQVVKSAYGGIFSMSQADMRAISNLTAGDISSIASQSLTYNQAIGETNNQLVQAALRTPVSEMMSNIYDNLITTIATGIADNPATMAAWKINDLVEKQTGGINIPFVNAMGFGLDLNANVNQLIKLGMVGISTIGQIPNMFSSLANGGGLNLAGWKGEDYTSRGTGFIGISEGVTSGTSQSEYIGSASGDDAQKSTLASAAEDAKETGEITNAGMEVEHTFDEFYGQLLEEKNPVAILEPDDDDSLKELFRRFVNDLFINDEPVMSELTDNTLKAILGPIGYIGELLKGSLFGDGAVSSYNSTTSSDISNLSTSVFNDASNNLLADANNVDIDRTKTLYSVLQNAMSVSGDASSLNVSNADLSSIYTYLTGDVGGTSLSNALSTLATTTNISDLGTSLDTNLSDVSTNINNALGFTESSGNLTSIIGSGNESLSDVLNLIYGETSIKTLSDNVTSGLDTIKTAIAGENGSGVSDIISDFSGKFDVFTQSVVPDDGGLKVDFSSFSFNADNELSVTLPADTLDSLAHIKLLYDELITNDTELYVNLKEESAFNSSLVAIKDEVAAVKALIEPNGRSSKLDDIKNTYDLLKSILGNGVASEEDTLANLMQILKNKINDASGFKVYATNSSTDVDTALGQMAHIMTLSGNY